MENPSKFTPSLSSLFVGVVIPVLATLLLSLPALIVGYLNSTWLVSDCFALFTPVVLWVVLAANGVGHQSLSHVIELFALVILMPALISVRIFANQYLPFEPQVVSYTIVAIGIISALSLRLLTPYIPE